MHQSIPLPSTPRPSPSLLLTHSRTRIFSKQWDNPQGEDKNGEGKKKGLVSYHTPGFIQKFALLST